MVVTYHVDLDLSARRSGPNPFTEPWEALLDPTASQFLLVVGVSLGISDARSLRARNTDRQMASPRNGSIRVLAPATCDRRDRVVLHRPVHIAFVALWPLARGSMRRGLTGPNVEESAGCQAPPGRDLASASAAAATLLSNPIRSASSTTGNESVNAAPCSEGLIVNWPPWERANS